jgi:hypothetical protein
MTANCICAGRMALGPFIDMHVDVQVSAVTWYWRDSPFLAEAAGRHISAARTTVMVGNDGRRINLKCLCIADLPNIPL